MALNDIKFQKQSGGMGRVAASEDPVSGLIMSMNNKFLAELPLPSFESVSGLFIAKIKYFEQLSSQYGLEETVVLPGYSKPQADDCNARNAIVYHVREFFRMSPSGTLYLAVKLTGDVSKADIKNLQYYALGTIRQMGIFTPTAANLSDYQVACTGINGVETGLEQEHQPLCVIAGIGKGSLTLATLKSGVSHVMAGRSNVSIIVSCDLDTAITEKLGESNFAFYGCVGNALGALSNAAVNESIAWVGKFPLGLTKPGFITGEPVNEVSMADLDLINNNRYIFVRTHTGDAGNYYNDSHTLDLPTSDYAYIENVRTMDKAVRGIRTNLLPFLNSPLYVDADTGKMSATTVATLQTAAGKALEDMEKAGELSGYKVEIDPAQNVLSTSEVEIQIKNVPVGVVRTMKVKIGLTAKLS